MSDCEATVPGSILSFDTADPTVSQSMSIAQTLETEFGFVEQVAQNGEERVAGRRIIQVDEQLGPESTSYIAAHWSEPDGVAVNVQAVNVSWETLRRVIADLDFVDAENWPALTVNTPLSICVDERTQYAPGVVPEGWERFVLEAQPSGTCDVSTFLFMSLVAPGTPEEKGTLVTFVSSPGSAGTVAGGEPIDINGIEGRLEESIGADGTPSSRITMQIREVIIGAHGNIDPATLQEFMSSIQLLDEAEWSQLVSE
ncbi:MAG: hypothetical protein ABJ201_04315 [Nisaea sp.]